MARVAVHDLIGWTLTMRAVARIPEPLANPARTAPAHSRFRAASAEGPPTWNYVVGRFPNGARPRLWTRYLPDGGEISRQRASTRASNS